jgi:hypothetical protein
MYETEAWGKARDAERLPAPRGNGFWTQEIYYQVLESGLRLPPSAGSASGVLQNPVGYNRVYVYAGKELDYDAWWAGLRAGRCFVTNGPLLRVEANGQLPGHVFKAAAGKIVDIELKGRITSRDPIRFIEVVQNGKVEKRVPYEEAARTGALGKLSFTASGWFLVRAIADNDQTFRFASTGASYVEIGDQPRISKAAARFFLDWTKERRQRVKLDNADELREVLEHHRRAEKFWQQRLERATVE